MNKLHIFIALTVYMIISSTILSMIAYTHAQTYVDEQKNIGGLLGKTIDDDMTFGRVTINTIETMLPYTIPILIFWVLPLLIWILILLSFIVTPFGSVDVGQ